LGGGAGLEGRGAGDGVGDGAEADGAGDTGGADGAGPAYDVGGADELVGAGGRVVLTPLSVGAVLVRLGRVLGKRAPATEDDAPIPRPALTEAMVVSFGGEVRRDFRFAFAGLAALREERLCVGGDGAGATTAPVVAFCVAGAAAARAPAGRFPPLVLSEPAARTDAAASVGTATATAAPRLEGPRRRRAGCRASAAAKSGPASWYACSALSRSPRSTSSAPRLNAP
jgi:hypothetical protein